MADRRIYFNTASGVTGEFPSALADISPNLVEVAPEQPAPIDEPAEAPAPAAPKRSRAQASTTKEED